jgi:small subunit ribosomal protein S16
MALKIRLARGGAKKRPFYRIVVAEATSPRDGRFVERIGSYNPFLEHSNKDRILVDAERAKYWLSVGAQPTDRVVGFLANMGLVAKPERSVTPLKSAPKKKAQERVKAAESAAERAAQERVKAAESAAERAAQDSAKAAEAEAAAAAAAAPAPVVEEVVAVVEETVAAPVVETPVEAIAEEAAAEETPAEPAA